MPAGSAAAKVEAKLKREYPGNKHAIYGTLNKAGLMHGNKVTAKGAKPARRMNKRNFKRSQTPSIAMP